MVGDNMIGKREHNPGGITFPVISCTGAPRKLYVHVYRSPNSLTGLTTTLAILDHNHQYIADVVIDKDVMKELISEVVNSL